MCCRSPTEPVNNVTIVEVLNNNQVFNFNQIEQVLHQTNQQSPQTSESLINSPRPSRSTISCTSENSVASPRQSSRYHQPRNTSVVEESPVSSSRSSSHSESNDRITNSDDVPQRSNSEIPNEGQRIKVRMADPEDNRPRRRPKRQEVVPPTTDQEVTNYEHLVLPTAMQSRPPPTSSSFIPTDMALLPTRPQVNFNYIILNIQFYIFLFIL